VKAPDLTAVLWVSLWAFLFVAWLIFAASLNAQEWAFGTLAAAAGVLAFQVSTRAEPLCFNPRLQTLFQAWRLPALILQGTWILIEELAKTVQGRPGHSAFHLASFHATGAESRSAARRALAIVFGTLPPNSLIIGIDRKSGAILFHQLRKEPLPRIVRRVESA
jgi:multisubunit Na+/H+ antiporter MnhE subunit